MPTSETVTENSNDIQKELNSSKTKIHCQPPPLAPGTDAMINYARSYLLF